ncbi:MAG: acetate kinase [bacterium]
MKILVLNCGSSSVKYQLIDMGKGESCIARGLVDKIGMSGSLLTHEVVGGERVKLPGEVLDHQVAVERVLNILTDKKMGVIADKSEISAVGHRVVHGGERFTESALVNDEVIEEIRRCADLAPVHNPHHLKGIYAVRSLMPAVPQVAVFDTAFHQTMPDYAYMYALPYILYTRYAIRRYGFHGTSHFYVSRRAADILGCSIEDLRIVTCHLGNGSSVAAIKGGRCIDTSMGFTPLAGLIMGTRCGDIDPAILLYVMAKEGLTLNEANTMMNKHSGLYGISGVSGDMREILAESASGNKRAELALKMFTYRLRKYIASYAGAMGGIDVLVFTAGIGENADEVRRLVCQDLAFLGIALDEELNKNTHGVERDISHPEATVKTLVIPTNEELVIARDTKKIVESLNNS